MNLLILSPGRRVEIVNYFKKEIHKTGGKVFTIDVSEYAPALYFGDKWYILNKKFDNIEKEYVQKVIDICKENDIHYVITLIDPELELLGMYNDKFIENGIKPIVSEYSTLENTFNKYKFYTKYKDVIPLVKTYSSPDEVLNAVSLHEAEYPFFAKLRNGSGSVGIGKINNENDLKIYSKNKEYMYQPFVKNQEYGVDVYFDMFSHKIVSLFMKKKVAMRAGETDKAVSVFREDILNEIKKIELIGGFRGPIDVDVFVTEDNRIYINEINPRFGGGYPHAYNCRVDFIEKIVNNINGNTNKEDIGSYKQGIIMMKYNGLVFKDEDKIY